MKRISLAAVVTGAVLGWAAVASADPFYVQDFNSGNGGYTTSSVNAATPPGPWTHGAYGVGGTGAWRADGGEIGSPFEHLLTTPVITVPGPGRVVLDFDHLYNFELDSVRWDGGTLMMNVNGGGFTQVPASAFTSNGYQGVLQTSDDWGYAGDMNGVPIFSGPSAGYPNSFIHSTADLGFFNAADTLQVQFRGGWDWFFVPGTPGWVVDNVTLNAVPEPSTLALMAVGLAAAPFVVRRLRRRKMGA